jgi:hypothetical protein
MDHNVGRRRRRRRKKRSSEAQVVLVWWFLIYSRFYFQKLFSECEAGVGVEDVCTLRS